MDVRELTDEAERREAVPILRQLWDGKTPDESVMGASPVVAVVTHDGREVVESGALGELRGTSRRT